MAIYPSKYEGETILKDGSVILLRPINKDDAEEWLNFIQRLNSRTKYLRLLHLPQKMELNDAVRFCAVDYINTFACVAEVRVDNKMQVVATGRYYRLPRRTSAEVAIAIQDNYQGKGLGTKLMEYLANVARDNDITTFESEVLADNESMMSIIRDYGFHVTSRFQEGVYHVVLDITRTRRVIKKEEERERRSTITSLTSILYPKSVAVIGASRTQGTLGQLLIQCILESHFSGTVYPVNPKASSIMSVKAYPSVLAIPDEIELAIIAVPAATVTKVVDECGRKGVRAIIVISDGFKERGPEGAAREKELRQITLGHGMRLVGPNCMGVINTDSSVNLNATFSLVYPPPGNIAFLSQSGAMGLVILEYAKNLNLGISTFVSVGNRADVSSNDLLQYWEEDPATKVILLYLESFGNPRKFSRIARRVSAKKPIVVVKGGSTQAGSRAASSHTGAMTTSKVISDELFRHAGIIRVDVMEELFNVASLLSNQPLPKGRRLAIITNGGGPGIIAADAAVNNGLSLPIFPDETARKLKQVIRRDIKIGNPIDMTAGATAQEFEDVLKVLARDEVNDAVLSIFIPPIVVNTSDMEKAITRVAALFRRQNKPLLACFLGQRGFKIKLGTGGRYVPTYSFPEEAVVALAKTVDYAEIRQKPRGKMPKFRGIKRLAAQNTIIRALRRSIRRPLWLEPQEINELLNYYGIRIMNTWLAKSAEEAASMAVNAGFPVAIKLASSTITHKTDVGGVVLSLNTEKEVKQAYRDIEERLVKQGRSKDMDGVIVQKMIEGGIETIIGVTQDPSFGPLIMFGSGGIYAELIKDVSFRLHPLTDLDAEELIRSVKLAELYKGYRGSPSADVAAIRELLLRLSIMVEDLPQIIELDFNPVKVLPQGEGYWILDARILIR